jgi:phosphoribosylaminoimidazolecarboxamide formyltransferase/IMP cyclohydrolase
LLASGGGSLAKALIAASQAPGYPATVIGLASDSKVAGALTVAHSFGVPTTVIELADFETREDWSRALTEAVAALKPDWVISVGFGKILGTDFLEQFPGRVLNTHPSLLPAFPGCHAVADALAAGVAVTGASIHFVDEGIDTGAVIAQRPVPIESGDDIDRLHERIKVVEREMLVETIAEMAGERKPIKRALISVYDKTGVIDLARQLVHHGCEVVSTGATSSLLREHGIAVVDVASLTSSPEMLGGRVKTLHPNVHAGLLAKQDDPSHLDDLAKNEIEPFDLLVVNLYPFSQTVISGASDAECVEQIDIGGPAMIRAAAKNFTSVAVLTDPSQYLKAGSSVAAGGFTLSQRYGLASLAFSRIAKYDSEVANWFSRNTLESLTLHGQLVTQLRYGENPHQKGALYRTDQHAPGLATAKLLAGKPMSYNNFVDSDAARRAAFDHIDACVAIIKHANPCGIAIADSLPIAYEKALACDPVSAFGGVVATNRPVDLETAQQISEIFCEVVIAPAFERAALDLLSRKPSLRVLQCAGPHPGHRVEIRFISGGFLYQEEDSTAGLGSEFTEWQQVSGDRVSDSVRADLEFAWRCSRAPHSNAIVLAKDLATVGIGMGQVNRVDSVRLAVSRAGLERSQGAVAASDAFFPFTDGLAGLIEAGIQAVVQPGGSKRDDEVVAAAQNAGVAMFFTNVRHFSH